MPTSVPIAPEGVQVPKAANPADPLEDKYCRSDAIIVVIVAIAMTALGGYFELFER